MSAASAASSSARRVPGHGARDLVPIVLFGYDLAPRSLPATPPAHGEVYADDTLRSEGVRKGTVILLGPERTAVRVVGFVSRRALLGPGTVWARPARGARC